MNLTLIRNATLRLETAGQIVLIDPMLGERHTLPSFAGIEPNPTVNLPVPQGAVLDGVTLLVVSHLHPDHLDPAAVQALPKDLPLLCQPGDESALRGRTTIWLGVWEHNARAIAFYRRWGFADVGTTDFMLGRDRQTDRIMARRVAGEV